MFTELLSNALGLSAGQTPWPWCERRGVSPSAAKSGAPRQGRLKRGEFEMAKLRHAAERW